MNIVRLLRQSDWFVVSVLMVGESLFPDGDTNAFDLLLTILRVHEMYKERRLSVLVEPTEPFLCHYSLASKCLIGHRGFLDIESDF